MYKNMLLHSVINNNNIYDYVDITVNGKIIRSLNKEYPFLDNISPIYMNMNIIYVYMKDVYLYILDSNGIVHFIRNKKYMSIKLQEMNPLLFGGIVQNGYTVIEEILKNISDGIRMVEFTGDIPKICIDSDEEFTANLKKYKIMKPSYDDYHYDLNNIENIYEIVEKSRYYYIKYKNGDFYKWVTTQNRGGSENVLLERPMFVCNIPGQYVVLNNIIISKYNIHATFKGRIKSVDNININMMNCYKFNSIVFSPNLYKFLDNYSKRIINIIIICNYYSPIRIVPKYLLYDIISNCL